MIYQLFWENYPESTITKWLQIKVEISTYHIAMCP